MNSHQLRTVLWLISKGMQRQPSGDEHGRLCMAWGEKGSSDLSHSLWVGRRGGVYGFTSLRPEATIQRRKSEDPPESWQPTEELEKLLHKQYGEAVMMNQERRLRAQALRFEDLHALWDHLQAGKGCPGKILVDDVLYYGGEGGTLSPAC